MNVFIDNFIVIDIIIILTTSITIVIILDRICTALCTYEHMVCPLSTLYLFWVYLVEGDLSRRYDSSGSYHQ